MDADGRNERHQQARLELLPRVESPGATGREDTRETSVVFDFSGKGQLDLTDLALVLTARLRTGPGGKVWVKEIPWETWSVLRTLGLDHLFLVVPEPGDGAN